MRGGTGGDRAVGPPMRLMSTARSALLLAADPDEIRRKADEIVARPAYQDAEPSLLGRVLDWLSRQFGPVFSAAVGTGRGYWFGYGVLFLALATAVYVAWRVYPRGGGLRRAPGPSVAHQMIERQTRSQWLARAREAEADGRWGEAVHARYHALTAGLADRRELAADDATTSGEHRQAFASGASGKPERVALFDRATSRFEWIWFGGARASSDDLRSLADADRDLLEDRS